MAILGSSFLLPPITLIVSLTQTYTCKYHVVAGKQVDDNQFFSIPLAEKLARVLHLVNAFHLCLEIYMTLYHSFSVCLFQVYKSDVVDRQCCFTGSETSDTRAVIILVPVRLGGERTNMEYLDFVKVCND